MPRTIKIHEPLVLFPVDTGDLAKHNIVPRGEYQVEPVPNPIKKGGPPWLRIVGEPWANAEACWQAVKAADEKSSAIFHPRSQASAIVLAALCAGLFLVALVSSSVKKPLPDVPALKMELAGLVNELENLTNHYPLLLSVTQRAYKQRYQEAIYSLDIYPRYKTVQQTLQREILLQRPDLENYVATINALDEELYHAWHDWGITNRPARIAGLQQQKARLLSTDLMLQQRKAYYALELSTATEATTNPCLEFNERLEHEIGDTDGALKEVARQNRDCADRAIKLTVKINLLRAQLANIKKPAGLFQTAGSP
jgi:hypothetical protein